MQRTTLSMLLSGLFIGLVSICYFVSMIAGASVWLTALLITVAGILLGRKAIKSTPTDIQNNSNTKAGYYVVLISITAITAICAILVRVHGDADAYGNWNFIAKYLADPVNWKILFKYPPTEAHPDYPLCLPGTIAFFRRLCNTDSELISIVLSFIPTLFIPILLFIESYRKSLVIAVVLLLLFITNPYYLNQGVNQYADTLLSFYFLSAFICMHYYETQKQNIYLLFSAAFLGCCMWTKNEGVVLAFVFCLFHVKTILNKKAILPFIYGILPFFVSLAVFKLFYAPANDLFALQSSNAIHYLGDKQRYKAIAQSLGMVINRDFYFFKLLMMVYLFYCIFARQIMSKQFFLLLSCFLLYMLVYLFTPRNLEWHLNTSMNRLLLHLLPAFLFSIAPALAKLRIPEINKE